MKLYLSLERIWTGTQADAKAAQGGVDYRTIEVPTDKPGLIAWLNEQWELLSNARTVAEPETPAPPPAEPAEAPAMRDAQLQKFEALARRMGWVPKDEVAPTAAAKVDASNLTEAILELDAKTIPKIVSAAISRLGEVAGVHGWAAFAKDVYQWTPASRNTEQGLGMLMLAALDQIGTKTSVSDEASA